MALALSVVLATSSFAARPATPPEHRVWAARWIAPASARPTDPGVFYFRKHLTLANRPEQFRVHITADNRYRLFVNGRPVARGPARGDLSHWRYDTLDLAPWLVAGENVLAVAVWNWGPKGPLAQHTARTALLVEGATPAEHAVNSDRSWKVMQSNAWSFIPVDRVEIMYQYYVAAPGDRVDGTTHPWGWETSGFDDRRWTAAEPLGVAGSRDWTIDEIRGDFSGDWLLVPRPIAQLEEKRERFARVRRATGVTVPEGFPAQTAPIVVPPHTKATLLLDHGTVTTAYPELRVSGGKGATVDMRYVESLWVPGKLMKGDRNQVDGKQLRGIRDTYLPDGAAGRVFEPLWWRAFRYMQVEVVTAEQPLTIDDISTTFTAYPFRQVAAFEGDAPQWLSQIREIGWRTNRLCSQDMYLDPYFEQLQYIGDTRIESLVSIYEAGDTTLMRDAIQQINATRDSSGLTFSRGPSRLQQFTPTFSLIWIGMLHDYWRYVEDPAFVKESLPAVHSILSWFEQRQNPDGTLRTLPLYNFLDSFHRWDPRTLGSYELQIVQGLQWAAELEDAVGSKARAAEYRAAAERLKETVRAVYWDPQRRLFADNREHTRFTQHMNSLAVLTGIVPQQDAAEHMTRVLAGEGLERATIYFLYYVHEAAIKAGLGDRYLEWLKPWRDLMALGVTTWPENESAESRSDCHGWGDHPNVELFRTILGVDSAAPGFAALRIEPHLGSLKHASGSMPHPRGTVKANYRVNASGGLDVELDVPVPSTFLWRGTRRELAAGSHRFSVP